MKFFCRTLRTDLLLCSFSLFLVSLAPASGQAPAGSQWPTYGGDPGGQRYTAASQITPQNVSQLREAWHFHTHALDLARNGRDDASFETTPVLLGHTLYLSTPFDEVIALDATSGKQLWRFDPQIQLVHPGQLVTSRGVALWPATATEPDPTHPCATRVLIGTLDARLVAVDAATGKPCPSFGTNGAVSLRDGVHISEHGDYGMTSPPTVLGDVVVTGSAVADNQSAEIESGLVRGFDVLTGKLLWSWEPLPWAQSMHPRTGAGNTWSVIAADPTLGLVYLPTSSASPDFYGGLRPGDNRDADSVVALDARTGKKVWAFQTVHHNLWDYDIAAEPLLFTFRGVTPAIAVLTKSAQIFVLDRRTGRPLFPAPEARVPQDGAPGEQLSPTQPISSVDSLAPLTVPSLSTDTSGWKRSDANTAFCQKQLSELRYDGIYTPPTLKGSLLYPGSLGGVNWGSAAFDPNTGLLYANNNRYPFKMRLVDRNSFEVTWKFHIEPTVRDWPFWVIYGSGILLLGCVKRRSLWPGWKGFGVGMGVAAVSILTVIFPWSPYMSNRHFSAETSAQEGTPYLIERVPLLDHDGNPCIAPPWAALSAVDLNTGKRAFSVPLGVNASGQHVGTLSLGGPIVTATGLVFDAATLDATLRAFDATNGKELWSTKLPAPALSTPMSYSVNGIQFVVVAAGGHTLLGKQRGDDVIAYALP
ncbi:quinoprotein glucose dehydrogenase [Bryocella elongata]|uniref:Quinoprotein glucose dehydrogenase n=1 Tax=Bryocella elongata TaxID=863522 RepID=A0A1H5SXR8_9BACT|nr:pyrroloquinoline quinone-dependent dehydrogenase [Bryocella elongata]SEF55254.1 quinoprotein glucose dehydrogenase [Bryocella elongata]